MTAGLSSPSRMRRAVRGSLLHCLEGPSAGASARAEYIDDALLLIRDGLVEELGPAKALLDGLTDDIELVDRRGRLLLPGFITDAIGFLLLITPLRRWLVVRWLKSRGTLTPAPGMQKGPETRSDRVIEGEYRRED